jgi:8-oxo-dGTP pyrophosphatase MutT (NUDIX family)
MAKPYQQTTQRNNTGNTGVTPFNFKTKKKKRKLKAYLIVHDGGYVLVGTGGWSGGYQRGGYHLPGGTIDGEETAQEAAWRELEEETGIDPTQVGLRRESYIRYAQMPNVTFVVARVANVGDLVENFEEPDIDVDDYDDTPFTGLVSLPSANCWTNGNFSEKYRTDWFRKGLYAWLNP